MRARFAGMVVALLVLGVAAQVAVAATTHQEYVDQVNAICKDAGAQIKRIPKKVKPSGDPGFDAYRGGLLFSKILGRTTRRIAGVDPVPEDQAAVDDYTDGLRLQKRLTDRSLRALKNGRVRRAGALAKRINKVQKRNARKAAALGLSACAKAT